MELLRDHYVAALSHYTLHAPERRTASNRESADDA
jgi:hypothetical protein